MTLAFYLDEDSGDPRLVAALRAHEVSVITAHELGRRSRPDAEHLQVATDAGCVLVSFNIRDFMAIHTQWLTVGRHHGGLILIRQQTLGVGETARRLVRISDKRDPSSMHNNYEFLSHWAEEGERPSIEN